MNWRDSARELDRSRLALESTWKIFILLSSNCDQCCRSCEDSEFADSEQQKGVSLGRCTRASRARRKSAQAIRSKASRGCCAVRQANRREKRDSLLRGTNAVATQVSPVCPSSRRVGTRALLA